MRQLLFRKSYYTGISKLPPDKQVEVYDAIMRYAFNGELGALSPAAAPLFYTIAESINADVEKYERKMEAARA